VVEMDRIAGWWIFSKPLTSAWIAVDGPYETEHQAQQKLQEIEVSEEHVLFVPETTVEELNRHEIEAGLNMQAAVKAFGEARQRGEICHSVLARVRGD
jgi:SpoU rRNA methylase family enzyme